MRESAEDLFSADPVLGKVDRLWSQGARSAGRTGEAIAIQERVAADRERLLGPDHPDTLTARRALAMAKTGKNS